jgi:hypothetical protein
MNKPTIIKKTMKQFILVAFCGVLLINFSVSPNPTPNSEQLNGKTKHFYV